MAPFSILLLCRHTFCNITVAACGHYHLVIHISLQVLMFFLLKHHLLE
ncbi:hypothetical protein D3Z63_23190 [Vibrio parahaemolyticus]|nr:hypothetical protein RK51_015130 [Vibrio parahaemolyticus]QGG34372.1 hypothetical protein GH799_15260 [Vibrio parahaemolyticus 10329]EGQ8227330.1 hypothetical protein [Vibrio parahaemolyticus]EGQ8238470.1 hypothetical protein [Vibrio parahaemolyticus]EGQ8373973.1 hypothetical protein [Vibrio parahaemolyticus]